MSADIYIRLERQLGMVEQHGQEDQISPEFGPFAHVQLTYNALRVGDEEFAFMDDRHLWHRINTTDPNEYGWSDVVIFAKPDGTKSPPLAHGRIVSDR